MSDPRPLRPPLVEVVDALSDLTPLEASELVKQLEDQWGVTAGAFVLPPPGSPSRVTVCALPPGTDDDIVWRLESFGPARRDVILVLRRITGLPLNAVLALEDAPDAWRPAPFQGDRMFEVLDTLRALGATLSARIAHPGERYREG